MGAQFVCDAPGCGARREGEETSFLHRLGPSVGAARVTALEIAGLRDRENPGEKPVWYLPPVGWSPVAMRDGRRLYGCSRLCREEIVGRDGRDDGGRRIGATCAACGQGVEG